MRRIHDSFQFRIGLRVGVLREVPTSMRLVINVRLPSENAGIYPLICTMKETVNLIVHEFCVHVISQHTRLYKTKSFSCPRQLICLIQLVQTLFIQVKLMTVKLLSVNLKGWLCSPHKSQTKYCREC